MPGAEHLRDNQDLDVLLQKQASSGKPLTAICAAPAVVLTSKGFLKGKRCGLLLCSMAAPLASRVADMDHDAC